MCAVANHMRPANESVVVPKLGRYSTVLLLDCYLQHKTQTHKTKIGENTPAYLDDEGAVAAPLCPKAPPTAADVRPTTHGD